MQQQLLTAPPVTVFTRNAMAPSGDGDDSAVSPGGGNRVHSQVVEAALAAPRINIQWRNLRHVLPIGVVGIISWSVWLTRVRLSRLYRPKPNGYTTTTSAVIPAFREDPDILDRCLDSWLAEGPTEIIVVPDVEDREVIQRLQRRAQSEPSLVVFPFVHTGKRSALGAGIRQARGEILVLADSDTAWDAGPLRAR